MTTLVPRSNSDDTRNRARLLNYFQEMNDCHKPGGSPEGGQFCGKEGGPRGSGTTGVGPRGSESIVDFGRGSPATGSSGPSTPVNAPPGYSAIPKAPTGSSGPTQSTAAHRAEAQGLINRARQQRKAARDLAADKAAPAALQGIQDKSLSSIASIVRRDWKKVNFAAKPYLDALGSLDKISDNYGADSGESIVAYFLGNAHSWRGPVAKGVKSELNRRLKGKTVTAWYRGEPRSYPSGRVVRSVSTSFP